MVRLYRPLTRLQHLDVKVLARLKDGDGIADAEGEFCCPFVSLVSNRAISSYLTFQVDNDNENDNVKTKKK